MEACGEVGWLRAVSLQTGTQQTGRFCVWWAREDEPPKTVEESSTPRPALLPTAGTDKAGSRHGPSLHPRTVRKFSASSLVEAGPGIHRAWNCSLLALPGSGSGWVGEGGQAGWPPAWLGAPFTHCIPGAVGVSGGSWGTRFCPRPSVHVLLSPWLCLD